MAQRKSAKKALRQTVKKQEYNFRIKQKIKTAIKKFRKAIESKDSALSAETLKQVYKTLDKAAAKNTIHKNKASRRKSRLSKMLNKTKN
ncbi:MAG: 30S ribosomal protein S20 [Candidatus Omnitrophica bacterium]|nr:30S ribosomal protein S20 [Candidatus Omnitrophota bacterium]MDD5429231.1 30S ribosomal protein S20 [Candidatus Omnitrophota bacterium]